MIEKEIKSLLEPLCGKRVFIFTAPVKTSTPYICYQPVSSIHDDVMSGQSGYRSQVFQIDVYSKNYIECALLVKNVIDALQLLVISGIAQQSSYETETELYRETIEISI